MLDPFDAHRILRATSSARLTPFHGFPERGHRVRGRRPESLGGILTINTMQALEGGFEAGNRPCCQDYNTWKKPMSICPVITMKKLG